MSRPLLAFFGDDFTGSTDALEQLTLAGLRTLLFIQPPVPEEVAKFPGLNAVGIAGLTRSLAIPALKEELRPALMALKKLGARHVHYKVCSTFDSSPAIGNIGSVMDVAEEIFDSPFIPLLAAAPALGRFTIFGTHFARFGIGSAGEVFRLDRHPSISRHPTTPMTEADLRRHLARQTAKPIALFDLLKCALPLKGARRALREILAGHPHAVLFDAVDDRHLRQIGALLDACSSAKRPLFSIGSSGIEMALAPHLKARVDRQTPIENTLRMPHFRPSTVSPVLVGSGSCSPVTSGQIEWALKHGFVEVPLNVAKLGHAAAARIETNRASAIAIKHLRAGRSVIMHTTRSGADKRITAKFRHRTAEILGAAVGTAVRVVLNTCGVSRLCLAGGDTSSFAARALGITALEMIAPLTLGAPLCRAFAAGSPVDQREIVFKGGQVGGENYFAILKRGRI